MRAATKSSARLDLRMRALLTFFSCLVLALAGTGIASCLESPQDSAPPPAYIRRGNEVEARYRSYVGKLEMYHQSLVAALEKSAPDLAKTISKEPEKPVPYGYQILPKLVADAPPPAHPPRASSNPYSWPRTDEFISGEMKRVAASEEKLNSADHLGAAQSRALYQQLVTDYQQLSGNQRLIDQHVQYNRFWQKAVAEDKNRFDHLTVLHDAVLKRQSILDELAKPDLEADARAALTATEKDLLRQIQQERDRFTPPDFVTVRHPETSLWIVQVPLYTDIQDAGFLRGAKEAIETVWRVSDADAEFRVELKLKVLTPAELYQPDPPPADGSHLDIEQHARRFPGGGGILTTGANSTFAMPGRYVALGPGEIPRNVLAHEFGHILGFNDGYFRGYRDLGEDGYQVLEIIPDPLDIMSTPGIGKVQRSHFELFLASQR